MCAHFDIPIKKIFVIPDIHCDLLEKTSINNLEKTTFERFHSSVYVECPEKLGEVDDWSKLLDLTDLVANVSNVVMIKQTS